MLSRWPEDITEKDGQGQTLLHVACSYKAPVNVVSLFLNNLPEAIKEKDSHGLMPLHCACSHRAPVDV
eukprot:1131068-Ditylum_brightwellii.AAC.1